MACDLMKQNTQLQRLQNPLRCAIAGFARDLNTLRETKILRAFFHHILSLTVVVSPDCSRLMLLLVSGILPFTFSTGVLTGPGSTCRSLPVSVHASNPKQEKVMKKRYV